MQRVKIAGIMRRKENMTYTVAFATAQETQQVNGNQRRIKQWQIT